MTFELLECIWYSALVLKRRDFWAKAAQTLQADAEEKMRYHTILGHKVTRVVHMLRNLITSERLSTGMGTSKGLLGATKHF